MNEIISIREFARRMGVSDTSIHKAIKSGRIGKDAIQTNDKNGRPEIIFEIAANYWKPQSISLNEKKEKAKIGLQNPKQVKEVSKKKLEKELLEEPIATSDMENEELPELNEGTSYQEALRQKLIYDAQMAKLKLEKEKGSMVYLSEIGKSLYGLGSNIRSNLMAIPDRVVDNMRAAEERSEAHFILISEINKVLTILTDIDLGETGN